MIIRDYQFSPFMTLYDSLYKINDLETNTKQTTSKVRAVVRGKSPVAINQRFRYSKAIANEH